MEIRKEFAMPKPVKQSAPARGRPRGFDLDQALRAAMEVFWKQGYMQSSLNDLCAAIGIKPPSFYCAFGTREKLFLATVEYYVEKYWSGILREFSEEPDIHKAFVRLFENAVRIYMRPNLPRGCFVAVSTTGLGPGETAIEEALRFVDDKTREIFRKRLMAAIDDGQIPADSDVPAIIGSLIAFLKGIAALARTDISQAELSAIIARGLFLVPPEPKSC